MACCIAGSATSGPRFHDIRQPRGRKRHQRVFDKPPAQHKPRQAANGRLSSLRSSYLFRRPSGCAVTSPTPWWIPSARPDNNSRSTTKPMLSSNAASVAAATRIMRRGPEGSSGASAVSIILASAGCPPDPSRASRVLYCASRVSSNSRSARASRSRARSSTSFC